MCCNSLIRFDFGLKFIETGNSLSTDICIIHTKFQLKKRIEIEIDLNEFATILHGQKYYHSNDWTGSKESLLSGNRNFQFGIFQFG